MPINVLKQLPSAKLPLVDTDTGKISPPWFRFLNDLSKGSFLFASNNLSDVVNPAASLANIGGLSTGGATSITTVGTVTTGTWNASIITGTYGGTGVNNGAATITLGGNLKTVGASALTFTTSGTTNATLPTGNITLVQTSTDINSSGIVTKTNNIAFATSATTDTTNASNISSGTLNIGRLPSIAASNLSNGTTGSGNIVLATSPTIGSPTLTTPTLGTPASGNLSNCTNYPIKASNYQTGVAGIPSFSAYNSTATTLTHSAFTKVGFQTKEFDVGTYFDATTNYRYTPGVAGIYLFTATLLTTSTNVAASTAYYLIIYKNGGPVKYGSATAILTSDVSGIVTALVPMNGTTDYVEIFFYNGNAANDLTTNNASTVTYFQGHWVGPST